jgi:hypothetical protein
MATRIDTVEGRNKLKPRKATYWHTVRKCCQLGFRRMSADAPGTWLAQAYDASTSKQTRRSLGDFSDIAPGERFEAARKTAEKWFAHLDKGGSLEVVTVKVACEQYVTYVRAQAVLAAGPAKKERILRNAADLEARYRRWVNDAPLGTIEIQKLKRTQLESWTLTLAGTAVLIDPHAPQPRTRPRAPSTVNRDMTALRAALNRALDVGLVTSDLAWKDALKSLKDADGRRDVYLNRKQRAALVAATSSADIEAFVRAMTLLPLRPGALAALTVENFVARRSALCVALDKAGGGREFQLPTETADFLKKQSKGKPPGSALFARADGKAWTKDAWKGPIKVAVTAANHAAEEADDESSALPKNTTAYTLRHSVITDLVEADVNALTIAFLSGTSVAMIEKHYFKARNRTASALQNLVL